MTLSVALNDLSDHSTDGSFSYILETYNDGSLVESTENESVVPA